MNWHAIFWINVPFGLLCIPLVWITIPESRGRPEPLDFLGLALVGIGLFGITYGIVRGNDAGWTSAEVLTGLIGGVALIVIFIWWESHAASPLLPLRLFSNRSFSMANIVGFLFFFGIFGAIFYLDTVLASGPRSKPARSRADDHAMDSSTPRCFTAYRSTDIQDWHAPGDCGRHGTHEYWAALERHNPRPQC